MKNLILSISIILLVAGNSFGNYLWIETNSQGVIGKEQEIRVYFGEYTHGLNEKVIGEGYSKVKNFTLFVVDFKGNHTNLEFVPKENYYLSSYTPLETGTYTVTLNNNEIDVIDYTKYDFGIFKTHYHAVAKIQVGEKMNPTAANNSSGITIKNISDEVGKIKLQILFKNKTLPKNEVKIFVADQWSKIVETDENGLLSFDLPWDTKYVVEVTKKEEIPGYFRGESYEFIWHCATHYLAKETVLRNF